jgi:hypothetical protein
MLSWREGVSAEAGEDGEIRVRGPKSAVVLKRLAPAVAAAMGRITPPGEDEKRLAESVLDAGGGYALARWYSSLQELAGRGPVSRAVHADGRRLATLVPTAPAFVFAPTSAAPDRPYQLSRFAYLRRDGAALVLESPVAHARIFLDDGRAAGLVGALARPAALRDLAEQVRDIPHNAVAPLLGLLKGAGMVQELAGPGAAAEAEPRAISCWEFHDLLFHARSCEGRSDAPFGAVYRFAGALAPAPAFKASVPAQSFNLYRPDLDRLGRDDAPFAHVLEGGRSIRRYADRPITAPQLGEFLYRVARVKESGEAEVETPQGPVRMEFSTRPYPSGGGLYELEFYVAVNDCDGLGPRAVPLPRRRPPP